MDSYRPNQQQYLRPPPPPPPATSDLYHYQQQPPPHPPPRPPLPPQQQQQQGAWYPNQNQFQYHSLNSPLPPPPGSYAPPPPPPAYYHPQSRPPPPQSYHPQQLNQDWGAQSRQAWDYPAHNNEQDWAAKARAWAFRAPTENQDQQPQFTPAAGRPEEQIPYHEQYPQSQQHQYLSYPQGMPRPPPGMHPPQDGNYIGTEQASYGHHTVGSAIPSGHQQEVPSSYSSVTGQEGRHHMQHAIPFGYGSHSADPATNPADQPLEFASGFASYPGVHSSSYPYHDSVGSIQGGDPTVPPMNSWPVSVAPGAVYPPTLPNLPSGPQHDPSMTIPSPIPGNGPHSFGSFPGLSLQPMISTTPSFALTAGTSGHPTVAFPGDSYGASIISERPKKASVPNWLREEIKKVSITSSSMDPLKKETVPVEDEDVDRSFGRNDQADTKSVDSSRSTEEEDDEDEVEAARTAAINKEIKRILTEVLSTVTDELFNEIATKVLSEDDLISEVGQGRLPSNHKVLPSSTAISAAKASAQLLIPAKTSDSETEDVNEKSSSSTTGDILGLANYDSDDDDDDDEEGGGGEIPSSGEPKSRNDQFTVKNSHESQNATKNGSSPVELGEHRRSLLNDLSKSNLESNDDKYPQDCSTAEPELPVGNVNVKRTPKIESQNRESQMNPEKHDPYVSKRSSLKENKDVESDKIRTDEKADESHRRHDERPLRNERNDDRNGSKERIKDQNVRHADKSKESYSRKRSSNSDVEEDKRETDRLRRDSSKEDLSRKRERTSSKENDRSKRKYSTDSSRHNRRRSSSVDSKDNSGNHAKHSTDESSENSKRKLHSRRHHSPSPVRSRRRQVSRSPHSKHSQRRHSLYSSLDSNRGKGSRSRSPVRRRR